VDNARQTVDNSVHIRGKTRSDRSVSNYEFRPSPAESQQLRNARRDVAIEIVPRCNCDAVACVGLPFGTTLPQLIAPSGGRIVLDDVQ